MERQIYSSRQSDRDSDKEKASKLLILQQHIQR